ncbi:hypothetical protein ILUMI_16834 [Ignelater luminosus]|uniref:Uncharacterized protein n=1 Tax=Ignelater luminosus TaxID=2038154 RepID=A0A8K0CMU4_IGNLU|nr:hypothetical protein ILUMI_16834 [Ignelater luminosus]
MPKSDKQCPGIKRFKQTLKEKNLSLWKKHIDDKDKARKEKSSGKTKAIQNECQMLCMDPQAVKVASPLNATKMYFKTKLGCHNFTIYNSTNHQATCCWFSETDCGLSASTFVSCILDYLERHCVGENLPIIIYSDGCEFPNRNNQMANALLNFSIVHGISIIQKYLTKGHTQMECDSAHSCIERKLKNRVIKLPSDYVKASTET